MVKKEQIVHQLWLILLNYFLNIFCLILHFSIEIEEARKANCKQIKLQLFLSLAKKREIIIYLIFTRINKKKHKMTNQEP